MLPRLLSTILLAVLCGLAGANEYLHPNAEAGTPTEIAVAVFILDLDGIDSQNQSFEANVFLYAHWQDPRLAHDGKGPRQITPQEIWTPNLQILNQQRVIKTLRDIVYVHPDGLVEWKQRYWGNFSQPLNLRTFPFDEQDMCVQVSSATGGQGKDITYVQSTRLPSGHARTLSVADWRLTDWSAEPMKLDLADSLPPQPIFQMTMHVQRNAGYYIVKVLIPLILIVAMSWIVFWIDPTEAGTQISVAITTMLTLIAYRFAVDSSLPNVSYLTALDYFIMLSTVLVYASLIEVLVTTKMAKRDHLQERARTVDKWCRGIFPMLFVLVGVETLWLRALG